MVEESMIERKGPFACWDRIIIMASALTSIYIWTLRYEVLKINWDFFKESFDNLKELLYYFIKLS